MIDMHSHILPGLDDGAADWEQSLAMARVAVADGITEMVCTPHWAPGKYENGRPVIRARFTAFEVQLAAERIPLVVHTGAELRVDHSIPERLRACELLTLNDGGRYVLLELPDESLPANLDEFFWTLQMDGYSPILSHVERNPYLREHPRLLAAWVEKGILTQITAASLLEEFATEIRDFALFLLEHRLAHMLVTDSHSLRMRKPQLSGARAVVAERFGPEMATRMVLETPRHILRGEAVPIVDPLPLTDRHRKKGFWFFKW